MIIFCLSSNDVCVLPLVEASVGLLFVVVRRFLIAVGFSGCGAGAVGMGASVGVGAHGSNVQAQ